MNRHLLIALTLSMLLGAAGLASASTHMVAIADFAFQPSDITISVGDTISWINNDTVPHTVTASDSSFDSGYLAPGGTYTHVFASPGSHPYSCLYHPAMTAVVNVSEHFHHVSIFSLEFHPADLTISVGDTVLWTNNESLPHTVTAADSSFDSGPLFVFDTFMHVFTTAGDFPYHCQYHSTMSAVVHVTASPMLYNVSISGFMFQPMELHVAVGDTVRWTNNDSSTHTVTATGGEFDSGDLTMGQSFTFVFTVESSYPYVCNYHSNMTGVVIVGNPGGGSSDWVQQTSPTALPLNDVRFWDENLGWAAGDQGILRTTDRGENWTLSPTSDDVEAVFFVSATEGWACGNDGMLLHSTNGGQSWQNQTSGAPDKLRDIWFADAMNGWAVGRAGILIYTTNGGQNWAPQSSPATDELRGIHMLDSQRGWIVGSDGLILYTSNGGTNWNTQLSVPNGEEDEFEAVYALDDNHVWAAGGQGRIFYTENGGQNWSQQVSGTAVALMDIFFPTINDGWVAGSGGFLGRWDSGMQMWSPSPAPAVASFNAIYFVNETLGFMVAGDGSIYKYDLLGTGADPHLESSIPSRSELFANYPNPFNPTTTIAFQLSAAGPVQLAVFNVLGRQITTLVDGPMSAGLHRVQFSGSDFPSGLYFYQLLAGEQTLTRRMMLVK